MIVWGIAARRRTWKILSTGHLCNGRVLKVVPLPARINSRTFFRVQVALDASDMATATATDTVDNWAVEYFLDARDRQESVDVVYSSHVPHRVILPMKIAITRRFD